MRPNAAIRVLLSFALCLLFGTASAQTGTVQQNGRTYYTGFLRSPGERPGIRFSSPSTRELPESYDARDEGLVTKTKNQGSCGSCWAFARTKALEAAFIKAGKATSSLDLAEQDPLVNDKNSYGCDGGFMDGRFEVDKGDTTEALCPYRTSDRYACAGQKFGKAAKWTMIGASGRSPTVDELRAALVQYGVLAVTVSAGSFSPNSEGRITSCGGRGINHMVTLVAYRPAPGGGYEFLIGNSWGESWGKGGLAWSKQGCNQLASVAGDAAMAFYVEGEGPTPVPTPLELPLEVVVAKGNEVALQVRAKQGVSYKWSSGEAGPLLWVRPTTSTSVSLKATAADGAATEQAVKITVK